MHLSTASCEFLLALALGLTACANDSTEPTGNVPPAPSPVLRWSDPASWPDHSVPTAGATVTIPVGQTVLLDLSPPPLGGLTVLGTLRFDRRDLDLTASWVAVKNAGRLEVGSETQ